VGGHMLSSLQPPDAFAPAVLRLQREAPSPLPRLMLHTLWLLLAFVLAWVALGQLDIVAVAQGRIIPQTFLKIVQPAEQGIVREILVKEGDVVESGQVLIRMDALLSGADRNIVANELRLKELQLRRIDAELSGTALVRRPGDPEEIFAQVSAQYRARRDAHQDAVDGERALLVRAQQDLNVALEIENKLRKTVPLYEEQAKGWERLANEGFAGRLMAMDRQRLYIESAQDLRAQGHNVESLRASIAQSEKRIAQISSNYRQQLQNERIEAAAHLHRLRQELDKHEHRFGMLELKAPQAGIIKDVATRTPGTVVAPGTILLTLVPQDEPLLAEVWVNNADAGFVQANQKARLKFAAYPFQKYGTLEGAVAHVSADAREHSDVPGAAVRSIPEAAYRTLITLSADHLSHADRQLRLVPGMAVSAEIRLGTRTVLEYLLSPIQKAAGEAGRER